MSNPHIPQPTLLFKEKIDNIQGNRLTSLFEMLSLDAEITEAPTMSMLLDFVEGDDLEPGTYIPELWLVVRKTDHLLRAEGIINRIREQEDEDSVREQEDQLDDEIDH